MRTRTGKRGALAALAVLALTGCAGAPPLPPGAAATELVGVPFFPQTDYQCGPAALATILAHAGLPVDAEALAPAVYIEGLQGSLQAELLAATRRRGMIPYVLAPDPAALFAELAAGRPVLVLQNLRLRRLPRWHYAVVVGVDPAADRVILRSGTEPRRMERTARFLRSWQLGASWAFVALAPGVLPATATPERYVRALSGAEPLLPAVAVDASYRSALGRWPDDATVLFAAAAREHAEQRLASAAAGYRRVLEAAPTHAAARNNLATVLAEQGCPARALEEARAALALTMSDDPLQAAIADTVAQIERAIAAGRTADGDPDTCSVSAADRGACRECAERID